VNVRRYLLIQLLIHGPLTCFVWTVFFALVVFSSAFCDPVPPIDRFLQNSLGACYPEAIYVWAFVICLNSMGWLAATEAGWYDAEFPEGEK